MADALGQRARKWTYLTWCDLRNHPFMLLGALVGLIVFVLLILAQTDTNNKVNGIQHTIKVPRHCRVIKDPPPPDAVILICQPATTRQIARAKARERRTNAAAAHRRAAARRRQRGTVSRPGRSAPGSPNGSRGIGHGDVPSTSPPTSSPSPGPSVPVPAPPSRPPPSRPPSVSVPSISVGPITTPSINVPVPALPRLPGG